MANEEKPGETFTITDISIFCEDAVFYSKQTFSDLIIIIEGQKIYAHKVILAARCEYFQYLLTENVNKTEITITDVPVRAFRKLLKFIYTGSITLLSSDTDLIFDIMKLASNYSFKKLEAAISEKISSMINFDNVFDLLNKAVANNMEGLTNVCLTFMDEDPLEILESDYLCSLKQKSMVKLLERDSFGAPEIDIFKSVAKWCKNNKDEKNLVMQCVRLSSLTNEEILKVVFPSKLVESEKLLTILAQAVDDKPKMSKSRQYCFGFKKEENLATREHRTKAISGVNSDLLLTGNRNVDLYGHHIINDQGQLQMYQTQTTQYTQMPFHAQIYIPNTMQYYNVQRPQAFVQPAAVPFPLYSMTQSHPSQSTTVPPNANKPLPAMTLSPPFQRQQNKRRAKAIPTIDPDTGVDRLDEVYEQQNNSHPPSGESSARQTPPHETGGRKFDTKLNFLPE